MVFTTSVIKYSFYLLHEKLTQKINDGRKVFGGQLSPKQNIECLKSLDNLVTLM